MSDLKAWQKNKNLSNSDILSQKYLERIKLEPELVQCACGCGDWRVRYDKKGIERRYIVGHSSRGKQFGGYRKERVNMYPVTISVRLTEELNDELPRIAAYENMKTPAMCRQVFQRMIERYERNSQYKRWHKRRGGSVE